MTSFDDLVRSAVGGNGELEHTRLDQSGIIVCVLYKGNAYFGPDLPRPYVLKDGEIIWAANGAMQSMFRYQGGGKLSKITHGSEAYDLMLTSFEFAKWSQLVIATILSVEHD